MKSIRSAGVSLSKDALLICGLAAGCHSFAVVVIERAGAGLLAVGACEFAPTLRARFSASSSAMRFWAAIKSDLLANMLDVFILLDEFICFVVVVGLVFMA